MLFYTRGPAVVKILGLNQLLYDVPLLLIASPPVPKCLRYKTAKMLKKASADIILSPSIIFSAPTMKSTKPTTAV